MANYQIMTITSQKYCRGKSSSRTPDSSNPYRRTPTIKYNYQRGIISYIAYRKEQGKMQMTPVHFRKKKSIVNNKKIVLHNKIKIFKFNVYYLVSVFFIAYEKLQGIFELIRQCLFKKKRRKIITCTQHF